MRIECEVCSATYTIDDAQLSDQPIGAQCPYCGHVKLVKRGDQVAKGPVPPSPFGATSAQDLGFGGPPPGFGSNAAPSNAAADLGPGLTINPRNPPGRPAPFPASFGAAPSPSSDLNMPPPFGPKTGAQPGMGRGSESAKPSWQIGNTQASAGGARITGDLELPSKTQVSPPSHDRFGALDGFGDSGDVQGAKCQVCGTALTDEFDKVIGLCDVHQRDRRGTESPASGGDAGAKTWYARHNDGRTVGPMSLEDLRSRIRQGELSPQSEFSKDGHTFSPMSRFQEIAYLASLALGGEAGVGGVARPRTSIARGRGGPGLGKTITWALVLVLLGGVGFIAYTQREKIEEVIARMTKGGTPKAATPPNPLKKQLGNWRLAHPDVSGTAHEHLITARARHLEDTWRSYQLAEDAYERALLLDEDDPNAIAGYVENVAIWRYPLLSAEELRLVQAALRFATELAPENPAVHRAAAALALARGELNPCRTGADKALERDGTDGIAKLILAGCYMEGNVQLAISEAEKAAKLVPELRRADRVLAFAYAKVGKYASAMKLLDARLKVDPKNGSLHVLYGQILRDLAQLDGAQQHFRQAVDAGGDVQEAQLALGDVLIEAGNYGAASAEYRKATEHRNAQPERATRAFAGLAHAELLRGRAEEAKRLADAALQFNNRDTEALLVAGEAALMSGSATTAMVLAKRALDARSGEPAALVLQGRALATTNAREKAIKSLEEAIANDPADARLKGILAAFYLTVGGTQQAYALMRKAAEIDPDERASRARIGPYAVSDASVKEAIENFRRSASEEANASVASSSMGMLYYHLGDKGRAIEAISRALRIDESNTTALLYDAQLALERGDPKRAQAASERILALERGTALGHLMLARSLMRKNELEAAREQYDAALRSNPGLLAAKVELAGLDIKQGDRDRGIQELARAFQVNPSSLHLRRLLLDSGF
jgi:tetratricopeptide (TPR) repeat protein